MRIAIRGSSEYSKKIRKILSDNFQIEECFFVEPINEHFLEKDNVISNFCAASYYEEGKLDKYFIPETIRVNSLLEIQKELNGFGINENDIVVFKREWLDADSMVYDNKYKEMILNNHAFHYLKYLEFHIVDHCNLNCSNCSHFSPYVEEKIYVDCNSVERDLIELRKYVDNIQDIRIMGGECLLSPDLEKYIQIVKRIFPYTKLHIVSNGLITDQISKGLIETIKCQDVIVDVSAYPAIFKKVDKLIDFFNCNNIEWSITKPIFNFSKIIDLDNKVIYPYSTKEGQFGCDCINLRDGYLAICPTVCYAKYGEKILGENKITELCKSGMIKISEICSFDELKEKINNPCELCNYCLFYRSEYDTKLQEKWNVIGGRAKTE